MKVKKFLAGSLLFALCLLLAGEPGKTQRAEALENAEDATVVLFPEPETRAIRPAS